MRTGNENSLIAVTLEAELIKKLREPTALIWLDKAGLYTEYVDELMARRAARGDAGFPHPVVAFRGSYLELALAMAPYGNGTEPEPLLIHMPGFDEASIRATPVYEVYQAGSRFQKALPTLLREAALGKCAPSEVESFLNGAASSLTFASAARWLAAAAKQNSAGLAQILIEVGPEMVAAALGQERSTLAERVALAGDAGVDTLRGYLHNYTGFDASLLVDVMLRQAEGSRFDQLRAQFVTWILCVEYVNDLARPPHLASLRAMRELSVPTKKACFDIVARLRHVYPDAYERWADEVEAALDAELREMRPEDLGKIDTFREEENRVLRGAVEALRASDWTKAADWATARSGDNDGEFSFWLSRDQRRRWAWTIVAAAAEFGSALATHATPLARALTLAEAATAYATHGAVVDRAHRRFEQKRLALLDASVPHFGPLQEVVGALREAFQTWADAMTRAFTALCVKEGFLPPAAQQQRTLFDQVVQPLVAAAGNGSVVAYFVVDALRYELAIELADELRRDIGQRQSGPTIELTPRLAELPTITAVGMNVLAPVVQGERLMLAKKKDDSFCGFKSGEFAVTSHESRARAMGSRLGGRHVKWLSLKDVCEWSTEKLAKAIKGERLVVVHSDELDTAGENGMGVPTFESTLRQLRAAWRHLSVCGVGAFVITADHGFLLQTPAMQTVKFGTKSDPSRRHIEDANARAEAGMVHVSMAALGYEGFDPATGYLLFRNDTAIFETSAKQSQFVHGGNSLQERVIPVLTISNKQRETRAMAAYVIDAELLSDKLGYRRLRVRVRNANTTLQFVKARPLELSLRVANAAVNGVVSIADVNAPAELRGGLISVPVSEPHASETWSEVFFRVEADVDSRVQIEVVPVQGVAQADACMVAGWVDAGARRGVKKETAAPNDEAAVATQTVIAPVPASVKNIDSQRDVRVLVWSDAISDEPTRRVFLHIEKYRSITEQEVATLLGSPRAARKFALSFEGYASALPFRIRIATVDGGKRYIREEDV